MLRALLPAVLGLLLALGACAEDVVIGRYRATNTQDSGSPDGGGAFDAGANDGGPTAADGGANDGGSLDGGSVDAGPGDGGSDGGQADAGTLDAGPNLTATLTGEWVLQVDAGPQQWRLEVGNAGSSDVSAPVVLLSFAPAVSISGPGCSDAGPLNDGGPSMRCLVGPLAAGAMVPVALTVEVRSSNQQLYAVTAEVLAAPGEATLDDNLDRHPIALTPVAASSIAINAPRVMAASLCAGTNIFSFAQCVPGSRLNERFLLEADGGFHDVDAGMPAGTGWLGRWALGAGGTNIVLMEPDSVIPYGWVGATVSTTCFEGVIQTGAGRPYAGAWRGCLQ